MLRGWVKESKAWASCVLFPVYSKEQFWAGRLQVGVQSDLQTGKIKILFLDDNVKELYPWEWKVVPSALVTKVFHAVI